MGTFIVNGGPICHLPYIYVKEQASGAFTAKAISHEPLAVLTTIPRLNGNASMDIDGDPNIFAPTPFFGQERSRLLPRRAHLDSAPVWSPAFTRLPGTRQPGPPEGGTPNRSRLGVTPGAVSGCARLGLDQTITLDGRQFLRASSARCVKKTLICDHAGQKRSLLRPPLM